jgi:hypothetical protein
LFKKLKAVPDDFHLAALLPCLLVVPLIELQLALGDGQTQVRAAVGAGAWGIAGHQGERGHALVAGLVDAGAR